MSITIHDAREAFNAHLDKLDKGGAVQYALALLKRDEITIPDLYEQVLAPALNRIQIPRCDETCMIWREHMMSNIVRAAIEAAHPFVLGEREKAGNEHNNTVVMLVCPQEEYHEIGMRMGSDFFTMLGYEVKYIGCNTPRDTLLDAARTLQPDIVGIGITNYLNLAQLPQLVSALKVLEPAPA
ncbi:MAG: cobalamin B12-binding domain-containing protein, partial [Firmicutes bacterium]|nr:cobalamin B12-binding domain-containing protein [Bacillota bacterium]